MKKHTLNLRCLGWFVSVVAALLLGGHSNHLHAQTTHITSSGLNTDISARGGTTFIDGGTRPGGGSNLFHSFGQFSVGAGDTAVFRNSDGGATSNIFGRVTGGNESRIFGTIDTATNFPTANLWLINPAGFLFGPTAVLNVAGSVNISTADYLKMTDGSKFFADPAKALVLSMEPVAAFGFLERSTLRPTFGTITVQGSELSVSTGKSLTMVGGDIEVAGQFNEVTQRASGFLFAPGGQIQLASVLSKGEVVIGTTNVGTPELYVDSFPQLGNIHLSTFAFLDVSGDRGGTVLIRGGDLTVDNSNIGAVTDGNLDGAPSALDIAVANRVNVMNASRIGSIAGGGGRGGDLIIKSQTLSLDGGSILAATADGMGRSGDINIKGGAVDVRANSTLATGAIGGGDAGNIVLNVRSLTGDHAVIRSFSTVSNAGNIMLDTKMLTLSDTSFISTEAAGATGNAGSVSVNAETVSLSTGSAISSATVSSGRGGSITITATDTVTLDGVSQDLKTPTFITAGSGGTGPAGDVSVRARAVVLKGGAVISSDTIGPGLGGAITVNVRETLQILGGSPDGRFLGGVSASTTSAVKGAGTAGNVNIEAAKVLLEGGGVIQSATFGTGKGGEVTVRADEIVLSGLNPQGTATSLISAVSLGKQIDSGNAGDVVLNTRLLTLRDGAQIASTTYGGGAGGRLLINVSDTLHISGAGTIANASGPEAIAPSALDSSTVGNGSGAGPGGEIRVTASKIALRDGGSISSSTRGPGRGGSILLKIGDNLSFSGTSFANTRSGVYTNASSGTGDVTGRAGSITVSGRDGASIMISGGNIQAQSETAAQAGNITLEATGSLRLVDTIVFTRNVNIGAGDAGSINISSGNDLFLSGNRISAESAVGSGGNIKLTAPNTIVIANSTLSSSVKGQKGSNGGNISIDPIAVAISNSQLLAQANAGAGGNINIVASGVLVDPNTKLDASAGPAGVSGSINIDAPIQVLGGTLVPLKVVYGQAGLSGDRCAADPQGRFSSFVQSGREGVPQLPGGFSPSPLAPLDQLLSGSLRSESSSLTTARLGVINLGMERAPLFRFHSGCHS